jgi:hypothetical protein
MKKVFAAFLLGLAGLINPVSARQEQNFYVLEDQVDVQELNRYCDEQGRLINEQMIYYDYVYDRKLRGNVQQVVAFRMKRGEIMIPRYNQNTQRYEALFHDSQNDNVLRKITSTSYVETWTQYDPEILERNKYPEELRRGLKKPRMIHKPVPESEKPIPVSPWRGGIF